MKKTIPRIAAACAAVLLVACTDDTGDDSDSSIVETQQQALERARDVEKDVAEAARRQAEEIERSEDDG